ncbi:protein kinase [Patescibacteria group bacterium]|nr:protein kinase [Patescibacteria group bacterium]
METTDSDGKKAKVETGAEEKGSENSNPAINEGDGKEEGISATPRPRFREVTINDTVDGYKILERIGQGGMGKVYRVVDEMAGKEAALKVLSFQEGMTERTVDAMIARFMNEAQIMWKMSDAGVQHVPKIYHMPKNPMAIVMELLKGKSMDRYLVEEMQDIDEVEKLRRRVELLKMLTKVADALSEAHSLGIIHRDLKAENILIKNWQGHKDLDPILLDFGIARNPDHRLTQHQQMMGTPSYMAPEQLLGKTQEVGKHSDIFAMGMLIFEVLGGEGFYDSFLTEDLPMYERITTMLQILWNRDQSGESNMMIENRLSILPIVAQSPVAACLAWNPADRIKGAYDLKGVLWTIVEELRLGLGGKPAESYISEVIPSDQFAGKDFAAFFTNETLMGEPEEDLLGSFDGNESKAESVSSEGKDPEPESSSSKFMVIFMVSLLILLGVGGAGFYFYRNYTESNNEVTVEQNPEPQAEVVMQPVMQPDVSIAMKPVVMKVAEPDMKKPVVILVEKPVAPATVAVIQKLDFEHFKAKCEKESGDHELIVKCLTNSMNQIPDHVSRYKEFVKAYLKVCKGGASNAPCIQLENQMASIGSHAGDQLIEPLKEKCMAEPPAKSDIYKETPTALLSCIRGYARTITDIELSAVVVARLYTTFCVIGPQYKRASVKECKWVAASKAQIETARWKHRKGQ